MLYIAYEYENERNVGLNEIAGKQEIPKHFLSKILQMLVRHKLLKSMKGPTGGFRLTRPPDQIHLIEVVRAIDGLEVFTQCGIGFKKCSDENPCPIHHDYKKVRDRVKELFENRTFEDLIQDIREGHSLVSIGLQGD